MLCNTIVEYDVTIKRMHEKIPQQQLLDLAVELCTKHGYFLCNLQYEATCKVTRSSNLLPNRKGYYYVHDLD